MLKETTQLGYFLEDIAGFDDAFFGISPKEAILMDPQQRISLEVTWEALEDAGVPPQTLSGSNTACFMGVNSDDYGKLLLEDLTGIEAWMGIGTAYCGIPNRISYLLDLRGPSTALDAACASSLVAIHQGRQSLLLRETDLAIVGGVNAICGPGLTRVLDKAGAISKDGSCRSFDDEANGYGRGEGAAVIILKRLNDAIRDQDRVHAVLKGSAVGQDGKTSGIMAPNGHAQQTVAKAALGNHDPHSIQYVEAHAASTAVGDPVEISAMSQVYGARRPNGSPCYIGSVKANVGHLEAGAGAVGFIKAVMALKSGIIPPQANFITPNKKIDWQSAGLHVPTKALDWPAADQLKRSAICSYGYGGSVSHVFIEEYPSTKSRPADNSLDYPTVILLSGPQEKRLSLLPRPFASGWQIREPKYHSLLRLVPWLLAEATTTRTKRSLF
jgi:6-methylsalicylic acid synthase